MSIRIQKKAGTWKGLTMMIDGQIDEAGLVTPSSVTSMIRLNIEDVQSVFDQFMALGDADLNHVVIDIAGKAYTFNREMAIELLGVVSVTCNDCEGVFVDEEYLPMEEWTEQYLMSL